MNSPKGPKDSQPDMPAPLGEVIGEFVDISGKSIKTDPEAERAREQKVAETLANTLAQTRQELIDQRYAGEDVDRETIEVIGEDLLEHKARAEELRQQAEEDPRP